jgi:hypothetical protein
MLDPTKPINGINTDPESALTAEIEGEEESKAAKQAMGSLSMARQVSDTSLMEGRSGSSGETSQTTRHHVCQDVVRACCIRAGRLSD